MSQLLVLSMVFIPPVDPSPARAYRELQNDIRGAFRAHVTADDDSGKSEAVYRMLRLHCEIVSHPKFATSETLQGYRAQLWSRLKRAQREIERQQRRAASNPTSVVSFSQSGALGGGAGPSDYGPALVALIERTIAPEFWDVHGGPGTIVYYRPLRVLVVRATDDVHGRIGGLLRAWH